MEWYTFLNIIKFSYPCLKEQIMEEEFDKETKERTKVDIEQEVDKVFYEEFIKFSQEAAIEEQILKLTQI